MEEIKMKGNVGKSTKGNHDVGKSKCLEINM